MNEKAKLISASEFAERIGVSHPTLFKWIKEGIIKPDICDPNKRYKFFENSVDEYFKKYAYREVDNE